MGSTYDKITIVQHVCGLFLSHWKLFFVGSDKPILESLNLFYHESETSGRDSSPIQNSGDVACLFCQEQFDTVEQREDLLRHLAVVHKFVTGDVNLITDLKK